MSSYRSINNTCPSFRFCLVLGKTCQNSPQIAWVASQSSPASFAMCDRDKKSSLVPASPLPVGVAPEVRRLCQGVASGVSRGVPRCGVQCVPATSVWGSHYISSLLHLAVCAVTWPGRPHAGAFHWVQWGAGEGVRPDWTSGALWITDKTHDEMEEHEILHLDILFELFLDRIHSIAYSI